MIYEIAVLPVYKEQIEAFRLAFAEVLPLLSRAQGYRGHFLSQGIERPEVFHLIVRSRSLEDHTPGFEASEDHDVFMRGIQEYFRENRRFLTSKVLLLLLPEIRRAPTPSPTPVPNRFLALKASNGSWICQPSKQETRLPR
jgi:heme-degrading monooxygenase HmoA